MKYFSKAILASLVVTIPTVNAYPNNDIPIFSIQKSIEIPDSRNFSYDEIVDLLAIIESDSFEERCSIDQLDQVNRLMSFLAMEGAAEDEKIHVAMTIVNLFDNDECQYAYWMDSNIQYTAQPAIFRNKHQKCVLCKSWFKKQWDQTRKFVKEHKKEIIIGAIIVVAVTVVVVAAVVISTSAAGAAAGGVVASGNALNSEANPPYQRDDSSHFDASQEGALTSSLQGEISTFKEDVARQQLGAALESNGISMEENGRIIGSLFTHKTIDTLAAQAAENPFLGYELQNLENHSHYPPPKWTSVSDLSPHTSIDSAFSTNYSSLCIDNNTDLNTLTYQARGDWALSSGYYAQAVQDFGKAIECDPSNSSSYLGRGFANFELGHYEESIADYNTCVSQAKQPFSVTDFSLGFAKGALIGAYESGKGALLFLSDFIEHPVYTAKQMVDGLSQLATLVKNDEFGVVAEALSPELHQLVTQWDTLPSKTSGELTGYAVGKLGTDLLAPGAVAKVANKSMNSAKELVAICKNIQIAQETLILETAAGIGIPARVSEIIEMGKKTTLLGEELGLTTKEMAALKQSGELEQVIGKGRDFFAGNLEKQTSYDFFEKVKDTLSPHVKKVMPETEVRNLIRQTGVPTFSRPVGIPENYVVQITGRGAGMEYVHPTNAHLSVRVMPGKPHSPHPHQQKPYVVQMNSGKAVDKYGNLVPKESLEAHIPLDEFIYRDKLCN